MIFVQISDLHLRAGGLLKSVVDSQAALDVCIDHILGLNPRPDFIIATGDLVQKAAKRDFDGLRRRFERLDMPVYVIPGNHDDRDMLRGAFADTDYMPADGFIQYAIDDYPLRLVAVDTVDAGRDGGKICAERLQWLDRTLAARGQAPTLIFMHHPPFKTGISFMDDDAFIGADELKAVIAGHPQIERIICGHMHRSIVTSFAGQVASVAPGVAFQMVLDLNPGAPSGFVLEPPALPLFLWRGKDNGGLVGHMSAIGDFGPRYSFAAD
jgi:3',5'-cyclic AMP phosphodiesterase CpdA